jgi:hypothetical protein
MTQSVGFGKYSLRTLEWLFFNDPGYPWWMVESGAVYKLEGAARSRFEELLRRARHLRVPGQCARCDQPITRMFLARRHGGGLAEVGFFCDAHGREDNAPGVMARPSFYTPDIFKDYDKRGGHILIKAIKHAFFGAQPPRMTQREMGTSSTTHHILWTSRCSLMRPYGSGFDPLLRWGLILLAVGTGPLVL